MQGTYTAVVDRIVDGKTAILLIEDGDKVIDQFDINIEELPQEVDEGSVLTVEVGDNEITAMEYLEDETDSRRQTAHERFDRLSERLPDS